MEEVLTCLILLLMVVVAGILSRLHHHLPTPLIQIAIGMVASLCFPHFHVGFNPELFMLLFIPPLLFSDSWHFPKREFLSNTRPIIMLSIGLVFFTVAGLGHLLHWLVPSLPLPACLALAAALSPTDAVSLKSICMGTKMPERIQHILQGEALLNDASGLIAFKFSVAAMLTGYFSFTEAAGNFLLVGIGGALIGVLLTYAVIIALEQLTKRTHEETSTENLLLLLLPYAAYLVAEYAQCSGILAAVAAGFTVDKAGFLDKTLVNMRIEGRFVWGMLESTLNGVIFILLGLYLPNSYKLLSYTNCTFGQCFAIAAVISCGLIALRFLWIYLTLPFELLIARHRDHHWNMPNLRIITAVSFGGIRGAIALAAILSLPVFMPDGNPFPGRDLLIAIVVGVVLLSLLLSAIILPLLIPSLVKIMPPNPVDEGYYAGVAAAKAAIVAIEDKTETLCLSLTENDTQACHQVASALVASLNQFIASGVGEDHERVISQQALKIEETLRLAGLAAARKELRNLRQNGQISNTTMDEIMHILDLRQFSLLTRPRNS